MVYMKGKEIFEEDPIEARDEGWWASVLADEEVYQPKDVSAKVTPSTAQAKPAEIEIDWERIETIYSQDEIVQLSVQGFNRGGLLVGDDGIQGFVPVSHLIDLPTMASEEQKQQILNHYVGQTLSLKIIECEPSQERIVFSERAAIAGQGRRKYLFKSLKPGDEVSGVVTNVTDFGVFVDLGGLEGLIHVSELSWGRVQHPGDVIQVGEKVTAQVLQISEENARVALSLKRLQPNPWDILPNKYKPGDEVSAEVTSIAKFGIFAKLNEGIEGLIHISSMKNLSSSESIHDEFYIGQKVTVRILQIEADKRRLGLSLVSNE